MAYHHMAFVYDRLMEDAPYDQWVSFTKEIFIKERKTIQTIADLGCGTGQITTKLAKDGFQMIGIDYSNEMLSIAEQRASSEKENIQWIQQDLRELNGIENIDAVISYCDVMNYITTEQDLKLVFNHVHKMLKQEGLFIFDIHSLFHAEENLIDQTFVEVEDDLSYTWFCSKGDAKGEMFHDVTFFVQDGDCYRRFDEYHHQRTYTVEFYKQLLYESGFEICNLYGDFSLKEESLYEKTERIFIVAQKGSGK